MISGRPDMCFFIVAVAVIEFTRSSRFYSLYPPMDGMDTRLLGSLWFPGPREWLVDRLVPSEMLGDVLSSAVPSPISQTFYFYLILTYLPYQTNTTDRSVRKRSAAFSFLILFYGDGGMTHILGKDVIEIVVGPCVPTGR